MRRLVIYKDRVDAPADLRVGERVELVAGGGPYDGTPRGQAIITKNDESGLAFEVPERNADDQPEAPSP